MSDIYVRLSRPEGYEDVHADLVLEDARIEPAFEPVVVTDAIERLRAERDEAVAAATRQYDQAVEATGRMLRAEQERDEARALLREMRDWLHGLRQWLAEGTVILRVEDDLRDIDEVLARLDALLAKGR